MIRWHFVKIFLLLQKWFMCRANSCVIWGKSFKKFYKNRLRTIQIEDCAFFMSRCEKGLTPFWRNRFFSSVELPAERHFFSQFKIIDPGSLLSLTEKSFLRSNDDEKEILHRDSQPLLAFRAELFTLRSHRNYLTLHVRSQYCPSATTSGGGLHPLYRPDTGSTRSPAPSSSPRRMIILKNYLHIG